MLQFCVSLSHFLFFHVFSADGDPHFVIDFPSSKFSVCFNIDGEPGDILRLVSDHKESGEQPSQAVSCGGKSKCKAKPCSRLSTKVPQARN